MGQAVTITRTEHTAEALREFAAQSRDGAQVRRLLAIALILEIPWGTGPAMTATTDLIQGRSANSRQGTRKAASVPLAANPGHHPDKFAR